MNQANESNQSQSSQPQPFASEARVHIGIAVLDIEESVAFYEVLFQKGPSKRRERYAKFEVEHAPVNFTLNQVSEVHRFDDGVSHFGIQLKSVEEVAASIRHFEEAGLKTKVEEQISCCYSVQNKVWVTDPQGNPWEIFVVLEDSDQYAPNRESECCVEKAEDATDGLPTKEACCATERGGSKSACC